MGTFCEPKHGSHSNDICECHRCGDPMPADNYHNKLF